MIVFLYLLLCFVLPNIIWQLQNKQRLMHRKNALRHIVQTYIFWVYCALWIHVAGIGTIWDILEYKEIAGGFNFIPFASGGVAAYLLNIGMGVPLGFLLPFIWKEFRTFPKVCLSGLVFSLLIEFFQIFSHNISDVNDVLMNTAGACLGYLIWIFYCRLLGIRGKAPKKKTGMFGLTEPAKYVLLGFLGVFLLFNWKPLNTVLTDLEQNHSSSVQDTVDDWTVDMDLDITQLSDVATIVCEDGTVEMLSCNELLSIYHQDPQGFEERYVGAEISFVDIPRVIGSSSYDDGSMYRTLTFANGWHVEFPYEGYKFIDQADKDGREIVVLVESVITSVWEYETNMFMIVVGGCEEDLADRTIIREVT